MGETYPEFLSYAKKRRQQGPRSAAGQTPPQETRRWTSRRNLLIASILLLFAVVLGLIFTIGPERRPTAPPSWVSRHRQRVSRWINLPKPQVMGQVPDSWSALKLGMRRQELDPIQLVGYDSPDRWADVLFVPDSSHPDTFFGLSFHKDHLYKIAVRIGEESSIPASSYVATGSAAYGPARSYEYLQAGSSHMVLVFQAPTGSRALKLDAVRRADDLYLSEVVLIDLDSASARELENHGRTR